MLRLIREVDSPFEYGPKLERKSAAELELFPITEFLVRAKFRLQTETKVGQASS